MGAHPYWYVVKYKPDLNEVLDELREREFLAGRYNPVMPFLQFPIGPHSPSPGAWHSTIAEAVEAAEADGTRSVLDLNCVSDEPGFGVAAPLDDHLLEELYGTSHPTRAMVEANDDLWDHLDRGLGVYIVLYRDDQPDEVYLAGYSYD
jgi:hypothetical protein